VLPLIFQTARLLPRHATSLVCASMLCRAPSPLRCDESYTPERGWFTQRGSAAELRDEAAIHRTLVFLLLSLSLPEPPPYCLIPGFVAIVFAAMPLRR